jgi:hypothetical protein
MQTEVKTSQMAATIPGYRYSQGPVLADDLGIPSQMVTIPGYRYSQGQVLAVELKPEIPIKSPARSLSVQDRHFLARQQRRRTDSTSNNSIPDSGIDVNSTHSTKPSISSSTSSNYLSPGAVLSPFPVLRQASSSSLAPMSHFSDVDSLESFGFEEERFSFHKRISRDSGWVTQLVDRLQKSGDTRKLKRQSKCEVKAREAQEKSQLMLGKARERAQTTVSGRSPMWLTTEERLAVETRRRQDLEKRLQEAKLEILRIQRYKMGR